MGRWAIALAIITLLLATALILVAAPWRFARPVQPEVVPVSRTAQQPRVPPAPAPVSPLSPPTPAAPTPAADEAKPAAEPPSARKPVAVATPRAALRPVSARDKPPTRSKAPAEEAAAPRAAACPRGASPAWCLRGSVTAADSRLREAYDDATRAGVNRKILVGIRSDWKHLRSRANKDPEALIRGYALLTQELRAEISRRSP
jgi:type IV secretory pathway VirB10-like protein